MKEVRLYKEGLNKTLHGLENGVAYYNYEGTHFKVFKSFDHGLAWLYDRSESLVTAEFDSKEELDEFLYSYSAGNKDKREKIEVDIRFLQQGLVKATVHKGFEKWPNFLKEEWANSVLQQLKREKGDQAILEALANLSSPQTTGEYFDEAPLVSAIEADDGDKVLFETPEWKEFKKPNQSKYLVFTSFNSGEHTNFIADGLEGVSDLVYGAFEGEDMSEFEAEIEKFMQEISRLDIEDTNEWCEFHNSTWITVTLSSKQ